MRKEYDSDSVSVVIKELLIRSLSLLSIDSVASSSMPGWLYDLTLLLHSPEYITLSAKQIYEKSGYSAPVVISAFRRYFSMSVKKYMTAIRMDRAKSLLTATKRAVLEIVSRLGYSSLSHFTRLFREYSGMPPSQYRMRWEEKHSVAD